MPVIRKTSPVYHAYGGATKVFTSNAPEVLFAGAAGTGKSRASLQKTKYLCDNNPKISVLFARKTRKSLTDTILPIWEKEVLPPGHSAPQRGAGKMRYTRHDYKWANGSEVVLGGMDDPTAIMSGQFDFIIAFEATELTVNDWELLTTRCRQRMMPLQQCIAECNPGPPNHWLLRRANEGKMEHVTSLHEDNPTADEGYLNSLRNMTGVRRKRLYLGQWAAAEGVVYENWNPNMHVIKARSRSELKKKFGVKHFICSKDWGYTNAGVTQVWGVDGDRRMCCFEEIYHSHETPDWWIANDKSINEKYKPKAWTCDPSRPEYITQYRRHGIKAVPADNKMDVGLQRVEERLGTSGDGKPSLYFSQDTIKKVDNYLLENDLPAKTIDEFPTYVWEEARPNKNYKEEPKDVNNHGMDAMRYAVMWVNRYGHTTPSSRNTSKRGLRYVA